MMELLPSWRVALGVLTGLLLAALPAGSEITRFWLLPGDYDLIKLDLSTPGAKFVALTFDDGPDGEFTPLILNTLRQYKVRATFFVLGERAKQNPDLVRRMVAEGHVVGSHSTNHVALNRLSYQVRKEELEETNRFLASLGVKVEWFRPPFGNYDRRLVDLAHSLGMRTVLWTVDPQDWQQEVKPEEIVRRVMGRVENGSVILLHSINPRTVTALPKIIDDLRERGFRLVTMDEWALLMSGKLKLADLSKTRGLPPAERPQLPRPVKPKPSPAPAPKPPAAVELPAGLAAPPSTWSPEKRRRAPQGKLPPYQTLGELALNLPGSSFRAYHSPPAVWRMFWPGYRPAPSQGEPSAKRAVVVEAGPPAAGPQAKMPPRPVGTARQRDNFPRPSLYLLTRQEIAQASLAALRPSAPTPIDTSAPDYQDRIVMGKPVLLPREVSFERLVELVEEGAEEIVIDGLAGVPHFSPAQLMALYLVSTRYYDPAPELRERLRLPQPCRLARFSAPREVVLVLSCNETVQWRVPAGATHLRRLGLVPVGLSWKQPLTRGEVAEIAPGRPLVLGFAW